MSQRQYGKFTIQAKYLRTRLEQKTETMTNNTTPKQTIIIPSYIKLAQPKHSCIQGGV
jgi:hypothetical protein